MSITASVEDLTAWMPRFSPLPRILIVRLYPPGVDPVEPNPFRFAVVAVIRWRVATIKALCGGVTPKYYRVICRTLSDAGVRCMKWRHDGVEKRVEI